MREKRFDWRLPDGFDKSLESARVLHGKFGENLAVELDTLFLLEVDKGAIGHPVFAERVVEADDPEASERSLLGATVSVSIFSSLEYRFLGGAIVGLSSPPETGCHFEDILSSFVGDDATLHSRHRNEF